MLIILLFSILTFKFDTSKKFQITVIISNSHNTIILQVGTRQYLTHNYNKIYYNK